MVSGRVHRDQAWSVGIPGMRRYRPESGNNDYPSQPHEFTLPKTEAGTDRIINLIQPAIDVLKNQAEMTRLGKQYQVEVKFREYDRTDVHPCTFVFNPQIVSRNGRATLWGRSTKRGRQQCDVQVFAIAEHTSQDTLTHVGR